ncbi:hypothetical protein ACIPY2_05605 [Paenarthrobacter sp. NPDC089675]|uniref:hypothetical protein n=1 Tax=Paenarthrobacter sp. NPDC089675 TaxID=3364376 RepID=UPI003830E867
MKNRSSATTWNAVFATFGPYTIANGLMLLALVLFLIFGPEVDDSGTYWSIGLIRLVMLAAGIFIFKGALGLRKVNASSREDRRRIAAGLPLEREQEQYRQDGEE